MGLISLALTGVGFVEIVMQLRSEFYYIIYIGTIGHTTYTKHTQIIERLRCMWSRVRQESLLFVVHFLR